MVVHAEKSHTRTQNNDIRSSNRATTITYRLIPPNGAPRFVWGVEVRFFGAGCEIRNITLMSLLRLMQVSSCLAGTALGSRTEIYSFCLIFLLYVCYLRYLLGRHV